MEAKMGAGPGLAQTSSSVFVYEPMARLRGEVKNN